LIQVLFGYLEIVEGLNVEVVVEVVVGVFVNDDGIEMEKLQ
jgi:hypothetical protein